MKKETIIKLTPNDIKSILEKEFNSDNITFDTKLTTVKRGHDDVGPLYTNETIFNGATVIITDEDKFYVFDNISKMYFAGINGWYSFEWVNDKNNAFLMSEKDAVIVINDLQNDNNDLSLGEFF